MKKLFSLLRASMTDNMNLFRFKNKNAGTLKGRLMVLFFGLLILGVGYIYADMFMEKVAPVHLEYVVLSIYILLISVLTLFEGIYKSGPLLFNCKDDNLLLSMPISRRAVLFTRIFKFYVFELLFNSMYLVPAMICYVRYVNPGPTFYLVSIIGLLIFPIIPIIVSCIFGSMITFFSSKFRFKNLMQRIITIVFLLFIMYLSFNLEGLLNSFVDNASTINEYITKMYYPAGSYINLINNFDISELGTFILSQIALFTFLIFLMSKVYFNVNSSVKTIKTKKSTKVNYSKIKAHRPRIALMKKEFKRIASSPVFIINAGFGLVMFVAGCIIAAIKFDSFMEGFTIEVSPEYIYERISCVLFIFIAFGSLMSSLTSSMISLEGKSYNILKILPVKPAKIFETKILTALVIIIPCLLLGDAIIIVRFGLPILDSILIILASITFPIFAQTMGLLFNLKYPKMDYTTDAEAVKQSMSTALASLVGMALTGLVGFGVFYLLSLDIRPILVLGFSVAIVSLLSNIIVFILNKKSNKLFNKINV